MRHLFPLVVFAACGTDDPGIRNLTPEVAVSPSTLDFGEVVVEVEQPVLELFVTNAGRAGLDVRLSVDDPAFTVLGDTTLEVDVDGSVTVPVQFAPTALGPVEASLVFTTNDPDDGGLLTVPLLGVGRVPYAPEIELRAADGSPTSVLDFGAVTGSATDQVFQIANIGDASLDLGSVVQTGAGTFSLVTEDPTGARIAPGGSLAVIVRYDATLTEGDSGALEIASNDADEPTVALALEANGGGSSEDYPVAVIDCPALVDLTGVAIVPLDGSGSYDPSGDPIVAYEWALVEAPIGADPTVGLDPEDQPTTSLAVDAVGDWEVSLVVTGTTGFRSVPAKCSFPVASLDDLHVELSWSGATSDLDLHLAVDAADLFETPGDVSWCNRSADWGTSDPADDGHLELDDADGYGPEHAGVDVPADGTYVVRVHHYDDGDDGDVTATVSVYTSGALAWSGSQVLARNEVWDVGQVNWPDGTFGVYRDDPWDAEGVRECR